MTSQVQKESIAGSIVISTVVNNDSLLSPQCWKIPEGMQTYDENITQHAAETD